MKRRLLSAFLAVGAIGMFASPTLAANDVVTVYGWSGDWDLWFSEWGEKFEEETGIQVQYLSGGGLEMFSRVLAEEERPKADLLLSSASYLFQLDNMGLLDSVPWDQVANAADVESRFKFDSIGIFGWDMYHIAYNTDRVAPEDAPRAWTDLADPKWAGSVAQRDPASDLTAWIWMALADAHGEEKAWDALLNMFENSSLWAGTSGEITQALAFGAADVAPASIGHIMLSTQLAGGAVGSAMPEHPILMLNGLGLIKDGPNPEGAVEFLNFFLGTYVQDFIMNKAGTSIAVNSAVELANTELVQIGLGGIDPDDVLETAYEPDWSYWTEVGEDGQTRLGALSAEIAERVKGL